MRRIASFAQGAMVLSKKANFAKSPGLGSRQAYGNVPQGGKKPLRTFFLSFFCLYEKFQLQVDRGRTEFSRTCRFCPAEHSDEF
jgi:hypothetical protein